MISGILSISIAFVAAAVAAAAYWLYYRDQDERFLNLANGSFSIMSVGIIFAIILLYIQIFTHNFQVNYVYNYTSLELSNYYLFSTFWAGQEGTFLLWLFYSIIFGIILIRKTARSKPLVMFFLMLVQSFLLLILLKKSPFAMIWNVHSDVPFGLMPADGASLNPLLQNPWMIIHPPVMFLGYSSTVVAFSFALSAMVTKDFMGWIKKARPWVIFSTLALGTGIILGGYWSYVTLGWGGYWAWDPVENASFVPWIFSAVLLHGLIIQGRQKGLVKTNLFLAGLAFIAVLWGSFLTRSGVLTDFSVHSFGESGLNLYLMAFVGLFTGIFLYLFFKSTGTIKGSRFAEGLFSRETFILIGMLTLLFTGITVFIGTSAPIYTGLLGKASNVSLNFYNTISIPVAIFLLLSVAIAPVLAWKVSELRNKPMLALSAAGAAFITIVGVILGLTQPVSIVLVFLSSLAIFVNGYATLQYLKKTPAKSGPYLAHVGIAFMIIGIITSSLYDRSEKVTLPVGENTKTEFGFDIKFVNFVDSPDGKDRVKLIVKNSRGEYVADPQFYYSNYTKSYMLSPHVKVGLNKDIYISPISFMPAEAGNNRQLVLNKHQSEKVDDLKIQFNKFIVGDHETASPMMVKADLTVAVPEGDKSEEFSVQPAIWMDNGQMQRTEVEVPRTDTKIRIEEVDAGSGSVKLAVLSPAEGQKQAKDVLAIEVSEKPLISILWFGAVIMIVGVAMSLVNRIRTQ